MRSRRRIFPQRMRMKSDLKQALERLDEKDRTIVVLRFFEDRRLDEIAEILDMNLNTVKSRLYRVMDRLKLALD